MFANQSCCGFLLSSQIVVQLLNPCYSRIRNPPLRELGQPFVTDARVSRDHPPGLFGVAQKT